MTWHVEGHAAGPVGMHGMRATSRNDVVKYAGTNAVSPSVRHLPYRPCRSSSLRPTFSSSTSFVSSTPTLMESERSCTLSPRSRVLDVVTRTSSARRPMSTSTSGESRSRSLFARGNIGDEDGGKMGWKHGDVVPRVWSGMGIDVREDALGEPSLKTLRSTRTDAFSSSVSQCRRAQPR